MISADISVYMSVMNESSNENEVKYSKDMTTKTPVFNQKPFNKLTDEEKSVANTVGRCLLENIALSGGSAYLAFRQTGKYIAAKGTPTMKSWASVIKFGAGFFTFSLVRSMYGRGVCLPRVQRLPPSTLRDKILEGFQQGPKTSGFGNSGDQLKNTPSFSLTSESSVNDAVSINTAEDEIDVNNHETDVPIKSLDVDINNHSSLKGQDFDYSRSYNLPPEEGTSKVVRRNKYGDIIEDV